MIIQIVPVEFQPVYKSAYPEYSGGLNIEEIIYNMLLRDKDDIVTDYVYLPIFWTSYYVLNGYGAYIEPILQYLNSLDKNKKYCTVVQYASGIYIDNPLNNLLVFSAGGGGLNQKHQCIKEEVFNGLKRHIFYGSTADYIIPLICQPSFPCMNISKEIYCSFMGRYDTHRCRITMYNTLKNHVGFVLLNSSGYDNYKEIVNSSVFTLAPRGYGYTSFRIYEAILADSIPVYIWADKQVLPFKNKIDWNEFCVIVEEKDIVKIPEILKECNILQMQNKLKEIKNKFTFDGIISYMKELLND